MAIKLTIGRKLFIGLGIIILITLFSSMDAIMPMKGIGAEAGVMNDEFMPEVELAQNTENGVHNIRMDLLQVTQQAVVVFETFLKLQNASFENDVSKQPDMISLFTMFDEPARALPESPRANRKRLSAPPRKPRASCIS
ncbi:MAG: hypothetical protein EOL87_10270 [Spartobacteria bacterium]|nr:hypothetical protein [Spartobacteria bacterium]